jgi:predicted HTH domain antitoxin
MIPLTVTVPDSAFSAVRRSPAEFAREMKLAAAIHWYQRGTLSQERAAELAGLNRRDFIRVLAYESIDVFVLDNDSLARELSIEADQEAHKA